ncbi:DUF2357 domain-containing protein [Collimonas sp. H4R21]|uniref:DUF2357 domain-containing protein n=1 Tax=Collimonas rhizosphaerae TaxID=3126357 RepID=A0ABU9PTC1_9BURK
MNSTPDFCELHVTVVSKEGAHQSHICRTDLIPVLLSEDKEYKFRFPDIAIVRLLIDDVELKLSPDGDFYLWSAGFFAGQVEISAIDSVGRTYRFVAEIVPKPAKVGTHTYAAMFDEIRNFDAHLLLGSTAATSEFGVELTSANVNSLVAYARMKQHGELFLQSVAKISKAPHKTIRPIYQEVSLSAIRKLHSTALMDRRLLAIVGGVDGAAEAIESIQLLTPVAIPSFDTAANRTMKALLQRFQANVRMLMERVDSYGFIQDKDEQASRKSRRLELLRKLAVRADGLLRDTPFSGVLRAETSSAGLTHIAANPMYSRAYRQGTSALRSGVNGDVAEDQLNVSPTWGIYETWCFVHLLSALQSAFNCEGWKIQKSATASAELAFAISLPSGIRLEALFQAKFNSENPDSGKLAWSLSKDRFPDIVFVVWVGNACQFLVLDAKYRSGRSNVLDAMDSAHIYHDSLRLGDRRPDLCLLLLPGVADVSTLDSNEFWNTHRVGALCEFSLGQPGVKRCVDSIQNWCQSASIVDANLITPQVNSSMQTTVDHI